MYGRAAFPVTAILVGVAILGGFGIFVAVGEYRGDSATTAGIGWFAFWITMAVIQLLDSIAGYLFSIDRQLRAAAPRPTVPKPGTPQSTANSPSNAPQVRESAAKPIEVKASDVVPDMPADFRPKRKNAAVSFSAIDEAATAKKRKDV